MLHNDRWLLRYAVALMLTVLMIGVTDAVQAGGANQMRFMPALLAVMTAGLVAGAGPAILSMIVSVVAIDYRYIEPIGALGTMDPTDRIYLTSFLVLAAAAAAIGVMARRAREQAEATTARLEALQASMPVGVTFMDNADRYVSINAYLADLNGKPVADHIGRHLTDVLPAEVAARMLAKLATIRQTGESFLNTAYSGPLPGRGDGVCHLRTSLFPVRVNGTIIGVGGTCFDVTAQQQADELIRKQAEEFQTLAENLSIMVFRLAVPAEIRYANPAALAYSGLAMETRGMDRWRAMIVPEDLPEVQAAWLGAAETGGTFVVEARLQRADDGQERWHLLHGTPVCDGEGRLDEWLLTATDIDDQKRILAERDALIAQLQRAEAEQRQLADDFRSLADIVPHIIWTKGQSDGSNYLNGHGITYFGLETGARASEAWYGDIHPDDVANIRAWDDPTAPLVPQETELRLRRHDGQYRWHRVRRTPVWDLDGQVARWIGCSTDIDEHKQAIQLRETFLSVASHELKTPITALLLQLHLLKRRMGAADPDLLRRIDVASHHGERLTKLVNNLLDVSRIISGRFDDPQPVRLREVIDEVVERFAPDLDTARVTVVDDSPGPFVGHWDRLHVDQILTNLLTNALKYGQGSMITIRLGLDLGDACLAVTDGGPGIAEADLDRVFLQYHRLGGSDGPPGHGLGLWIVQHLTERMGGKVSVHSQMGEGATFTVRLPMNVQVG